jgi:membrane protein
MADRLPFRTSVIARLVGFRHLSAIVLQRFLDDRCLIGASALSYTTIVSMVPLTAIALVVFSGFSQFGRARDRLLGLIVENFAPDIGDGAVAWFTSVAGNAAQTTAIGVLALVVTSILLLATVEEHLHFIFRVTKPRGWGQRVLAYWTILTLGPILIGVLLSVSGAVDEAVLALGLHPVAKNSAAQAWSEGLRHLIAPALEITVFTLLYRLIPNRHVIWRACLGGGALAALLLEILKLGFGLYIARMSSYSTIYGALAGVPIALLWMYIFWAVVLLGAEVAVCVADAEAARADAKVYVETPVSAGV